MSSLFNDYEHQYSNITADITVQIGSIRNLQGAEKLKAIKHVEKLLSDTTELLEQMGLETHSLGTAHRGKFSTRVKSYEAELKKLQRDLRDARILSSDGMRQELFAGSESHEQKERLLENTERLERGSRKLDQGYRTCLETEEIGERALLDLQSQRETISRSTRRLEDMDSNIGQSSRVLGSMMRRIIQSRVILIVLGIIIIVVIIVGIYFGATRHK